MISRMKKRIRIYSMLFLIVAIAVAAGFVCMPNGPYLRIKDKVLFRKEIKIKEGLDLQGGARLVYSADLSKIEESRKDDAMSSLSKVIENRVNGFGIAEPLVQTSKVGNEYRLIVELPGVKDLNEAINLIGKTAELDFREVTSESAQDFTKTDLTGKDFKSASVSFDQSGNPQIDIEFNAEGAKKFEAITERNVQKPLAIYLDNELVSAPTVNQKISGGKGQITGKFDIKEAKNLAIQLNAGALPVQVKIIEERNVGATLGRESVARSIYAGVMGIIFVSIFMIYYYRLSGIFSTIGLGLYIVFIIALVKLFGITLTMGGVAGLILSVGMSMETDVLVFERIREELRSGKTFPTAIKLGFKRAWPSVRDSNAVSLIIAGLLYTAGGTIRGFAVILGLGIIVGLITTFVGTKTLMSIAVRFRIFENYKLFAVKKEEVI
jgi:preprotein translocase subunit SecD